MIILIPHSKQPHSIIINEALHSTINLLFTSEDISEEDRAEPVQARLLMVCLVVVVSYF